MHLIEWYTEERAATALAVSTRTIRRMAQDGTIRRALRPAKGRKPEPVYHPEDVERIAAQLKRPMPVPDPRDLEAVAEGPPPAIALRVTQAIEQMAAARLEPQIAGRMADALERIATTRQDHSGLPGIPEALERMAELLRRPQRFTAPPLWLSVEQAAEYSGLSQAFIRRLIDDGRLAALRDRSLKVHREDLDKFRPV